MNKLPQHIIEEIEKRRLAPRPRFHFLLKRGVFWTLAFLASVLGGIALTIIIACIKNPTRTPNGLVNTCHGITTPTWGRSSMPTGASPDLGSIA